ncbi:hypothetical protein AGR1C_pAt40344 [Agrobacterium fabacearum TT111]|nr:hypothetical protein AGR1C_pAt40344 [Agrobacterium fabacearum TT111]
MTLLSILFSKCVDTLLMFDSLLAGGATALSVALISETLLEDDINEDQFGGRRAICSHDTRFRSDG